MPLGKQRILYLQSCSSFQSYIYLITMNLTSSLLLFGGFNMFWASTVALTFRLARYAELPQPAHRHVIFRGVKVVHGCLDFLLCSAVLSYIVVTGQQPPACVSQSVMLLSASYYLFDLIFSSWMRMTYTSLVLHHILSLVQIFGWMGWPAYYYFSAMALMEVSVGPMNLREILRYLGMRFTKVFELTERVFFYSILVARGVLLAPVAFIPMLINPGFPLFMKVNSSLLWALCIYFCSQIWRRLQNRLRQNKEMLEKGVEFGWFATDESTLKLLSFGQSREQRQI